MQSDGSMSVLEHLDLIKDLGVMFDSKLKFDHHINEKVNKDMGLIYRNFKYMSSATFVMLYKTFVRSHLEYADCVWSPYRRMDIEKIEKYRWERPKWFNNWGNTHMRPD